MSSDRLERPFVKSGEMASFRGIARRLRRLCRAVPLALSLFAASFGATAATANPSLGEAVAAARNGDPRSQYVAGMMYLFGQGARRDIPEATRWLQMSARAGLPQAMVSLAGLYDIGVGVPFDVARATQLRQQAARAGYTMAQSQSEVDARLPGSRDYRRASVLTDLKILRGGSALCPQIRRRRVPGKSGIAGSGLSSGPGRRDRQNGRSQAL